MKFEKATRGDLARVVSQWGDTRNPKVGPNQIITCVKLVNAVERALLFFFQSRVAISNSYFLGGPGTRSPQCIKC